MNILVAVNKNYLIHMKTLLLSIAENNKCKLNVYLMQSELSDNDITKLDKFIELRCNGKLHLLNINIEELDDAPIGLHFSKEMYYRIFCSDYLPKDMSRILWLDSDIIVKDSIENFYNSDFKSKSIIACAHREADESVPDMNRGGVERLGFEQNDIYFNSGVILFNLDKIRKEFDKAAVLQMIDDKKDILQYPDQDILNIIYRYDTIYADKMIYNYQVHYDWTYKGESKFIKDNVKIIHFAGSIKPWGNKHPHVSYEYYWKYYLKFNYPLKFIKSYAMMIFFSCGSRVKNQLFRKGA